VTALRRTAGNQAVSATIASLRGLFTGPGPGTADVARWIRTNLGP
jgi:hypothetical protein